MFSPAYTELGEYPKPFLLAKSELSHLYWFMSVEIYDRPPASVVLSHDKPNINRVSKANTGWAQFNRMDYT